MILFKLHPPINQIYPGDREQVQYWTRKWGITKEQLNEAIIETGSISSERIKNHLVSKGIIFSFFGLLKRARQLFIKHP